MVIDYFLSNRVTGWVWGYLMIGQPELHMGYITALWGWSFPKYCLFGP